MDERTFEAGLASIIESSNRLRPEFEGRYDRWACLSDDTAATYFDQHYLYHVAWAVRKLASASPRLHVDFGSSLNFCSTVSAICETRFYDIRPAEIHLSGLTCLEANLTALEIASDSLESVSCMHVLEHIGLGRYGDDLDPCGDLKAIAELKRVVAPNGALYVVAPTGLPRIAYNAHRIYAADSFVGYFSDEFQLEEFYFIDNQSGGVPALNVSFPETRRYDYGCGCYFFRKKRTVA
jgi:hypothetical protein